MRNKENPVFRKERVQVGQSRTFTADLDAGSNGGYDIIEPAAKRLRVAVSVNVPVDYMPPF